MTDTHRRPGHRPPPAANDNLSRATRLARRAWAEDQKDIRGGAYHTLHLIVGLADVNGRFYVDGGFFADALKISPRSVFNHLDTLISANLIRRTGEKRWVHSYYQLTLPPEASPPDLDPENPSPPGEGSSEQSRKTGANKTSSYPDNQIAADKVSGSFDWKRNRKKKEEESTFRSSASQLAPLSLHEAAHLPENLREGFIGHFGLATARSWLFPCSWSDDGRTLQAASRVALEWFESNARRFCNDNGITVRLKQKSRE